VGLTFAFSSVLDEVDREHEQPEKPYGREDAEQQL
jgi:hypothetical protein